jgi:hypothetical protein
MPKTRNVCVLGIACLLTVILLANTKVVSGQGPLPGQTRETALEAGRYQIVFNPEKENADWILFDTATGKTWARILSQGRFIWVYEERIDTPEQLQQLQQRQRSSPK